MNGNMVQLSARVGRALMAVVIGSIGGLVPLGCGGRTLDGAAAADAATDAPAQVADARADAAVDVGPPDAACVDEALLVIDAQQTLHRLDPASFASLRATPTDCLHQPFALAERRSDHALLLVPMQSGSGFVLRLDVESGRCTEVPAKFTTPIVPGFTYGLTFVSDPDLGESARAASWSWGNGMPALHASASTPLVFNRTGDLPSGPCQLASAGSDLIALCRQGLGHHAFVLPDESLTPIPAPGLKGRPFTPSQVPAIVAKGSSVLVFGAGEGGTTDVWRWERATRELTKVGSTSIDVYAAAYARDCRP